MENSEISLQCGITVVAAGKTPKKLQEDIQQQCAAKHHGHQSTAKVLVPSELFSHCALCRPYFLTNYSIDGEVKAPNMFSFMGNMTVLRAVESAGGFKDFADRKKIKLIRTNGKKFIIDGDAAKRTPRLDLPLSPDDQIVVHRKAF